ncbi:MAG: hypothetical protein ACLGIN_14195 [Candidatus Sericytochromatia bacterium]
MTRRPVSRALGILSGLTLAVALAGCDVPNVPLTDLPGVGGGEAKTLTGSLKGVEDTEGVRVGLLGRTGPGKPQMELRSTAVTGNSFNLTLPATPPLDFMVNDNESIVLMLTAYRDDNGNGRFDESDEVLEAAAQSGTVRFFTEDGPPGGYKKGWNLFQNGSYTQNFNIAFDMNAGVSAFRVLPFSFGG